jgi:exodeoxyribonuclease V gamma subunit
MLYLHTSNRLENLADRLADLIKQPLASPFDKEIIIVQSKGMERWLSMELARRLGVWANGHFPFPDAMLWRLFRMILGNLSEVSQFEREVMAWSLMEILPNLLTQEKFSELRDYLQEGNHELKLFQLATTLAEVFDLYLVFRPQWIRNWETDLQPKELENNSQAHWQALLWRALIQQYNNQHEATVQKLFLDTFSQHAAKLPKRLSLFAVSILPPFHLEVFAKLGNATDIHLFMLNPCQEYWAHILSKKDIAHRSHATPQPSTDQYLEEGNSLLASMGKVGQDFIDMLLKFQTEVPMTAEDFFTAPQTDSLLAHLQRDMLYLRQHGVMDVDEPLPKAQLATTDKSVQIHVCHSQMREVEVLHDQLLALFEQHPDLHPQNIVVMMPEVEKYAPYIQAVFSTQADKKLRIPFSITDRSLRAESTLIDNFFIILELIRSRFTATEVLNLLDSEAVQQRFQLTESEIELIRQWVEATRIRWGANAANREAMELPYFSEYTWENGLQRMLLGYALPAQQERLFADILPFDDIEGHDSLILGKLADFLEKLFDYAKICTQSHHLIEWQTILNSLFDTFLSTDEATESQAQAIRNVLNKLVENAKLARFHTAVSYEVILAYLRHYLESEPTTAHFLTGHVTFCSLLPMRSIPFKVVCLLGMSDRNYPRSHHIISFDLISQVPAKPGDRSRRQNDRYSFLEALLAAREVFYLSYVGHSIHDNTVIPPSVLVNELLETIETGFFYDETAKNDKKAILNHLITHHPMQAFSHRYFDSKDDKLFSYSSEYCVASDALLQRNNQAQVYVKPFFSRPLPEPQPLEEWQQVTLDQLVEFFSHPIKYLFNHRLGIRFKTREMLLDSTEPFRLTALEEYQLKQLLVEKGLHGQNLPEYQAIVAKTGQLPHDKIGNYVYEQILNKVLPFISQVQQHTALNKLENYRFNLSFQHEISLSGQLAHLWQTHLLYYRCAKVKGKDYVKAWLQHLVLNTLQKMDSTLPTQTILIAEDRTDGKIKVETFAPVADSAGLLQKLLDDYWRGVRQPLLFFPESSFAFAEMFLKTRNDEDALAAALNKWRSFNDFGDIPKEGEDEYHRLGFGDPEEIVPLEHDDFKAIAKRFFIPMLQSLRAKSD